MHPLPEPRAGRGRRDDTTRYLRAAAQMSSEFANQAIREYLVEPTRQVPPSPGFDAVQVLEEAIAARTRRIARDLALLMLAVLLAAVAPWPLLIAWAAPAAVFGVFTLGKRAGGAGLHWSGRRQTVWLAAFTLVAVLLVAGPLNHLLTRPRSHYDYEQPPDRTAEHVLAVIFLLAAFMVLAADRVVVWKALTRRLRGRGQTEPPPRILLDLAPPARAEELRRVHDAVEEDAAGGSDPKRTQLIVYRGYSPFVGAGRELNAWSTATSLVPAGGEDGGDGGDGADGGEPVELSTAEVYRRVEAEICRLRESTSLTPSRRMGDLSVSGLVIASAEELFDHLDDPSTKRYLPAMDRAPKRSVSAAEADRLRAEPKEWARYYQCYQVETWDRELVLSVFVHLAVDRSTLYVEWKPCVLMPILREYKDIDKLSSNGLIPLGQAVLRLALLPASLPSRLVHLARWLRRLPAERGVNNPDRYGCLRTGRELAADNNVHNYLQRADVDRYLKILESRFVLVVSGVLREFGYSSTEFDQRAAMVVTNNLFMNSNFNAPVMTGGKVAGDVTGSGTMTAPPAGAGVPAASGAGR